MPLDLDRLAEFARAATPGPWELSDIYHIDDHWVAALDDVHVIAPADHACGDPEQEFKADGAYIAAISPDVVLELIERARTCPGRLECDRPVRVTDAPPSSEGRAQGA